MGEAFLSKTIASSSGSSESTEIPYAILGDSNYTSNYYRGTINNTAYPINGLLNISGSGYLSGVFFTSYSGAGNQGLKITVDGNVIYLCEVTNGTVYDMGLININYVLSYDSNANFFSHTGPEYFSPYYKSDYSSQKYCTALTGMEIPFKSSLRIDAKTNGVARTISYLYHLKN